MNDKYKNFKTFTYSYLPDYIKAYIKDYMSDKFIENSFIIQPIGILSDENDRVLLYDEELTSSNSNIYEIQKWFIEQGCLNEDVLILINT